MVTPSPLAQRAIPALAPPPDPPAAKPVVADVVDELRELRLRVALDEDVEDDVEESGVDVELSLGESKDVWPARVESEVAEAGGEKDKVWVMDAKDAAASSEAVARTLSVVRVVVWVEVTTEAWRTT
jgi:hypothetical protein